MSARRPRKSVLLALKVDAETAAALEALPNRSEFIREALRARMDSVCPLCHGTGRRPSSPATQLPGRRHLHALPRARCADCGREAAVLAESPLRERADALREHERLRTFLAFGDFFCPTCYARTLECEACGHRIAGTPPGRDRHACAR
jgi:hypothetical protein